MDMNETPIQPENYIPPITCVKCGKQATLIRRLPVSAFGLEEKRIFECTNPKCGHQMEIDGRR